MTILPRLLEAYPTFNLDDLPELAEFWPGAKMLIERVTPYAGDPNYPWIPRSWIMEAVELDPDDPKGQPKPIKRIVIEMWLYHPDSTLIVHYDRDWEISDYPEITLMGMGAATNREIIRLLPLINKLRLGQAKPEGRPDVVKAARIYDKAWERIKAGEPLSKVRAEFVGNQGEKAENRFDAAMYRRRKRDKT